ncbi:MAG: PSD1 and planctomycete cytochrome C domain-containing protein [Phycisphaerales bacterium JB039]
MRPAPAAWGLAVAAGLGAALVAGSGAAPGSAELAVAISFNRDIRPILSRCLKCHGPDPAVREADLRLDDPDQVGLPAASGARAIVPGDPDASELIRRIATRDPDLRMPPLEAGDALTPAEIELLRDWIAQGADYQRHWSFQPVEDPQPPQVPDDSWAQRDLDRFVLARLTSAGLAPTPAADRYALLRRVSLDLTGLPPTPEEVHAFISDAAPDAWERVVDRLLASERFGERWAAMWLDLARYADTKGYEADRRRTMWPWRDRLIRALNDDMPLDEFTRQQIAGDLLADPAVDQLVATGFHRNTMTNDEGGTDDEEFRVAAVFDRVETTMQVWMGLTFSCARCHTHKYDPITNREYYGLYAFFNQTEDADRMDEAPTLAVLGAEQEAEQEQLAVGIAALEAQIAAAAPLAEYVDPGDISGVPTAEPVEHIWIDDRAPVGSIEHQTGGEAPWPWAEGPAPAHAGARAAWMTASEFAQFFATEALAPLRIGAADRLFAHVWIDSDRPAREVMLQFHSARAGWSHRAYWGENLIAFGADGTPERLRIGDLPPAGAWVRLEVAAADVGLRPGDEVNGWAFSQHGGRVGWDHAGIVTSAAQERGYRASQSAWERLARARAEDRLPADVRAALDAAQPTESQSALLRGYYLREVHEPTWLATLPLQMELAGARARMTALEQQAPRMPIMRELPPDQQRQTRILERGSFLSPGETVEPGVPGALHGWPDRAPRNRLGLADWLVARENPLTSRVMVNRIWARLFGAGLVATEEDFGTQGALPSHPELLDHLATFYMESGWRLKPLLREIVTSATYMQSAVADAATLEADPANRLLSRGPSVRLPAEMLRDQALAVSELLSDKMYGPPVFPPQPDGVWQVVYSGDDWTTSAGEDRYRRALYTFWRRTSPYPSMMTFDAPSREVCVSRRIRTSTPLQALITLNDPVFVEAAQALGRAGVGAADDPAAIARWMLERALCRPARPQEIDRLVELFDDESAFQRQDLDAARTLATDPLGRLPEGADPAQMAAWTVVAQVILNLDEILRSQ